MKPFCQNYKNLNKNYKKLKKLQPRNLNKNVNFLSKSPNLKRKNLKTFNFSFNRGIVTWNLHSKGYLNWSNENVNWPSKARLKKHQRRQQSRRNLLAILRKWMIWNHQITSCASTSKFIKMHHKWLAPPAKKQWNQLSLKDISHHAALSRQRGLRLTYSSKLCRWMMMAS